MEHTCGCELEQKKIGRGKFVKGGRKEGLSCIMYTYEKEVRGQSRTGEEMWLEEGMQWRGWERKERGRLLWEWNKG